MRSKNPDCANCIFLTVVQLCKKESRPIAREIEEGKSQNPFLYVFGF